MPSGIHPGCRVHTLAKQTIASLRSNSKPVTIQNFKRTCCYIACTWIMNSETRRELRRQALLFWLKNPEVFK